MIQKHAKNLDCGFTAAAKSNLAHRVLHLPLKIIIVLIIALSLKMHGSDDHAIFMENVGVNAYTGRG